ncbi:MAG: hypothetical protein Q9170_002146 [Blastenia crenularia]
MAPPPARPRDKGGTAIDVAAKEYANSNSTSAKFLGGPQKSWMTGQMETLTRPNAPLSQQTKLQLFTRLRERLAGQPPLDTITVPLSIEDTPNPNSQSLPDRSSLPPKGPGYPLHKDARVNIEMVLPSPAPSDEHRPESLQPVEPENDGQTTSVQEAQIQNPQSSDSAYGNAEIEAWNTRLQNSVSAMTPPSSSAKLPYTHHAPVESSRPGASPVINAPLQKKRKRTAPALAPTLTPIATSPIAIPRDFSTMWSPSISPRAPPPHQHRPSDIQMRSFLQAIITRQQWVAEQNHFGRDIELARLNLLQCACAQDDQFYMLLHQIYCTFPGFLCADRLITMAGFRPEHFKGLQMINLLLLSNSQMMTKDATEWFANFPCPLENLLRDYQIYHELSGRVRSFLTRFEHCWPDFQKRCTYRHYPPFVDEQIACLGVESPMLQSVIFRAIHKNIWVGTMDDPCFGEGEKLFQENQHLLRQRSGSLSSEERRTNNQNLAIKYQRIQKTHWGHLPRNTSNRVVRRSSIQPQLIQQMSNHTQGRLHGLHNGDQIHVSHQPVGNPLPPNTDPRFAQHPSTRPMNTPSTIVPSQLYAHEQDCFLVQQGSSGTVSARPAPVPPSTCLQNLQTRGMGSSKSYTLSSSRSYTTQQQQQTLMSDPRCPKGPRSVHDVNPDQSTVFNPVQSNRHPSNSQSSTSTTNLHATMFNGFGPQQVRTNSLPQLYWQPFLPVIGQIIPARAFPDPSLTALHQYHSRSPVLMATDCFESGNSGTKYFRYIKAVTVLDQRLRVGFRQHLEWRFDIDETALGLLSGTIQGQDGSMPQRSIQAHSAFCRVRCIDASRFLGEIGESEWVVTRQIWPSNVTMLLNDKPLDLRKKNHYGKDLPADITSLVQKGTNSLSVSIIRAQNENQAEYAIGVESIRLLDREAAKAMTRVLPYEEARRRILQRFRNADPDIEVVDASITISLTDPYTTRIWDVPVRSTSCHHDQCFDLDTFLETRKSKRAGQPSDPDQFKCPICDADARPQKLIKDQFFVYVREVLVKQDELGAKAIVMQPDGSWNVKKEIKSGETGDGSGRLSEERNDGEGHAMMTAGHGGREIETIEIDND